MIVWYADYIICSAGVFQVKVLLANYIPGIVFLTSLEFRTGRYLKVIWVTQYIEGNGRGNTSLMNCRLLPDLIHLSLQGSNGI